uniref:Uncharacterized protein n=1 Tax=Setaria italica TaxID=4555 RepID=K3ZLP3_SETIT
MEKQPVEEKPFLRSTGSALAIDPRINYEPRSQISPFRDMARSNFAHSSGRPFKVQLVRKVTGSSSSRSRGSASTHHSNDYTPSLMREEEVPQEEHSGPQAMEVEGPLLDLHSNWEMQAYTLIKDRVFAHTQAFDSELLESIGMDVDFANVWHTIGWNDFKGIPAFLDKRYISSQVIVGKFAPRCNKIHNPTLRLMHKWLALSLFGRFSPVEPMISQWLEHFKMIGPIECTSLITRIASKVRALDGIAIPYIQTPHTIIDEAYLIQGHILKHDANQSLKCRELTLPLIPQEEARRSSVFGRVTWSKSRNEATTSQYQPPQSQHVMQQMYQAGWVPTGQMLGFAPGASSASGNKDHMDTTPLPAPVGFATWQQLVDTQFNAINTSLQQSHNDLQAYFHSQGYNPYPGQ